VVLAPDRLRYLLRHGLDVIVVALPLLRPLRLLRLVPLLRVLNQRATTGLRGRLAIYVAGGAALLAFCGALTVLDAERANPDANITGFGDAIWWAATTMTTVGYGDRYPTTGVGRLAAVALMVAGIAVLGVVTATLASWLVEQVKTSEQELTEELREELADLGAQLTAVEAQVMHRRRCHAGVAADGQRYAHLHGRRQDSSPCGPSAARCGRLVIMALLSHCIHHHFLIPAGVVAP
jgi:voltage-gated potassium channel